MNLLKYSSFAVMAIALGSIGLSATADAQFYKGKRVNIIINYGAGGNTDIQGRMVMRHMAKYIPGKPRLIFRHVSGAGGVVGALGDGKGDGKPGGKPKGKGKDKGKKGKK